ncbi:MAG: glycyl radical protein [Christensenellales bacterium]
MEINSIQFEATERIRKLRQDIFLSKPKVCPERAVLITEAYRQNEDQPIMRKRAIAFDHYLRNSTVNIYDGELIVGHMGRERRSCPVFPEMFTQWLEEELDTLDVRPYDPFEIKEDAKEKIRAVFPYWRGKTIGERIFAAMPGETRKARLEAGVFGVSAHEDSGLGHVIMDHERILAVGFREIIGKMKLKRAGLDLTKAENLEKDLFYEAGIKSLEAGIHLAHRYGDCAKEKAGAEKEPVRKKELEKIAEVCYRVPAYPARDFHEALQCVWFVQLLPQMETDGAAVTVGRLDQFMYPYFTMDRDAGIPQETLQELLDAFWLKFAEMVKLYKLAAAEVFSGFPMGENIIIGGMGKDGQESVNELSYMCLDAHRHCRLYEPNFSVRINKNTSELFLTRVCENIKMGTGHPVIFNEDIGINSLVMRGIPLGEARNYAPIGCVENSVVDMWMRANGGYMSLAKLVELTMHDGVCQLTKKQVGHQTGLLEDFKTFDDFFDAYRKQMQYFVNHFIIENNLIDNVHRELAPVPVVSSLYDSCVESGKCVTQGGARYNFTCPGAVGVANAADSMAALKKLVFEEKRIDPKELRMALAADYEGYEPIRQMLIQGAPKYGNDIPYVDLLAREVLDMYMDEIEKHSNGRGGRFVVGLTAITSNITFGKLAAATPDGRKNREVLAEGASPAAGRDTHGPTASMKSVTKLDHVRLMKGMIYNQKFSLPVIDTPEGIHKFTQLLRSYCDLGGAQVQYNVISRDTLLDAQAHPDQYRDLVVRVAGYSAFYTELSKQVQDQIIRRTEFSYI